MFLSEKVGSLRTWLHTQPFLSERKVKNLACIHYCSTV